MRSPAKDRAEVLKIVSSNPRYSAAVAIVNYPNKENAGAGVPKLFSPSGNIPEIYLMQDYKKEIVEINRNTRSLPLGIRTTVKGENFTLKFYGLENFSSDVSIYDAKTGLTQALTETQNEFQFLNAEGNQEDRFYLIFSQQDVITDINTNDKAADIRVYTADGIVRLASSPEDLIQSVEVYNVQGQLLLSKYHLSAVSYQLGITAGTGVYLVKVQTTQKSVAKKVIID
jgi:hypothetical protein